MNTPFFTVTEDGPAALGSCGVSLVTSSSLLDARFFPLSLELKRKVRFNVPSVCCQSVDTNSAEDLIAISSLPPTARMSGWGDK